MRFAILVALALLVASGAWASPPQQDRPGANQTNAAQNLEQSLGEIAGAINSTNDAPEYNQPCEQGQDNRRSDLCAQWKAADAAYESAVWTRRMYPWIVAGTIIGGATLLAAIAAAMFAHRAAVAAEKGHATAETQLRAYLESPLQTITRDEANDREYYVEIVLKNAGSTPARLVTADIRARFGTRTNLTSVIDHQLNVGTLAPGADFICPLPFTLPARCQRALEKAKRIRPLESTCSDFFDSSPHVQ